jgi:hypothetical protein
MKEDKNLEQNLDKSNEKLHISDVIDSKSLESFYTEYNNWCENLWAGQFYVKWLKRDEFFESIKTYDDWINLQKEVGLIEDDRSW